MPQGFLTVVTTTASKALPVAGVALTIVDTAHNLTFRRVTDASGNIDPIAIEAPDVRYSLDINSDVIPYTLVDMTAIIAGYQRIVMTGIEVFAGQTALVELDLAPVNQFAVKGIRYAAGPHLLTRKSPIPIVEDQDFAIIPEPSNVFSLKYPVIPKFVTIHLGRPSVAAQNVTVTFKDYIKNVACSEIYPTWPEQSLRANIYCQISLALNRIYTEWYRAQGFSFDITNSTAYDQYYVHGRNIFENISNLVELIFNEYIRKDNSIVPFYAEYCDGKTTTCPGLKQWGTVTLANQGRNALEILKYYYGNAVELITTDRIEGVTGSFPGLSLRTGARGDSVAMMQNMLNRIAVNYPVIPVALPVDGVFGTSTEATVRAFQKQFKLTQDGIVGSATWYKVCYLYVAVTKLAELTAEAILDRLPLQYPGFALRQGDRNIYVQEIQFMIQRISTFTTSVPFIKIDSSFGTGTRSAVISFQRLAGLSPDGVVGALTWASMRAFYDDSLAVIPPTQNLMPAYPGTPLRVGSTGENVRIAQNALNTISQSTGALYSVVVDGIFGNATASAVRRFQASQGLNADGVIGPLTWNAMRTLLATVVNNPLAYSAINFELYQKAYLTYTGLIYDIDNEASNM